MDGSAATYESVFDVVGNLQGNGCASKNTKSSSFCPGQDLNEVDRLVLLAEHVEERVSVEHANWINNAGKANEKDKRK